MSFTVSLLYSLLAFAQRAGDVTIAVASSIFAVIFIMVVICCAALLRYLCKGNSLSGRHPVIYTNSACTNISRNQRSQINTVTVSGGSTAPPAPPSYTASYSAPSALPYNESYNVPPNPAPSYTVPPAPNTSTSVPISMLAPHADLSADEPPPYSSFPQQSAEAVQQCDVQNQVEAMAAVQTPPGIVCAVSDNSETRDQELSPRPRNQELPLPSIQAQNH